MGTPPEGEVGAPPRSCKGTSDLPEGSLRFGGVEGRRSRCSRRRLVQGFRDVQAVRDRQISQHVLNGRTGSPRKVSIKALVALASRLTHALRKVARPADHFVSRKGRCGTSQDSEFVRLWKEYGERFSIDFIANSWRIAFVDAMREARNQIVHDGGRQILPGHLNYKNWRSRAENPT
jgi:hypothetical protein